MQTPQKSTSISGAANLLYESESKRYEKWITIDQGSRYLHILSKNKSLGSNNHYSSIRRSVSESKYTPLGGTFNERGKVHFSVYSLIPKTPVKNADLIVANRD